MWGQTLSHPVVVGFLNWNYHYTSVATLIPENAGFALIPYSG